MKKMLLLMLCSLLLCRLLPAQYLLLDDMEGHGPCSGRWTYFAGEGATGSVVFNVPNPAPSPLNPSSHVARFVKDTTCFAYMSASCGLPSPFDLTGNSTFKMLVYSNVKEDVMFKLQPGNDHTKAVFFTYRIRNINQWEEATFNFQSVSSRTDLNRIAVQFIDGRKANGTLYFDLVQAPNPIGITLGNTRINMGQENGVVIPAKLNNAVFSATLTPAAWTALNLPPGVSIGSVQRLSDTTANIVLAGNSPANYSRTVLKLTVAGSEVQNANTPSYTAKGNVVFEGNPGWTLIFSDEFNTSGLPDRSKWTVDPRPKGWINGEQQVYTDTTHDNIRVRNGNLVITGKKDFPTGNATEPWSSGRLISQGKMDFLYGKVEVRAKLPKARGSWPAIWLMPTTSAYGAWPRSGELDIMEHVGNDFGKTMATIHTQNHNWTNGGGVTGVRNLPDANTAYHVYAMEWTPDSLLFTYDSSRVLAYGNPQTDWKDWPFDQKFHLILNLAIGGGMGGNITEADWPDSMNVDYVRVYQKGLGTPVLDTIMVSPANQAVLAGKSIQYTAKAYDQNGHVMAITPVWSVTGAGNTISVDGLATFHTSGTVTATATVDTVTRSGIAYANVRATNYKPVPARIEAEAFDNSHSCCTEPTKDTSGVVNVSYIGKGTWFEYDMEVPDSGSYRMQFRVAVSMAASLGILLDSTELAGVALPASGGWQNWITVTSAPFVLRQGKQTIRIRANTDGWNFNWLKVVRAADITLSRISVSPDSVTLIAGASRQFSASGYDQYGNALNIAPIWKVNNDTAMISPAGLFTAADTTGLFRVTASADTVSGAALVKIVPVPVLTRISIAPDTVTVPVGASQQFTVTGYDQFDSLMAVTAPQWTVSGAGNSISSKGVLTAGDAPGSCLVKVSTGALSDSAQVTLAYTCSVNNRYEAESASSHAPGPYLQPCTDAGGGQNFAGLSLNHWFAYSNLQVPVAGRYRVSVRVSSTAPARIGIGHSGVLFGTIDVPSTGGAWQTVSDTMTLPALTYTGVHVKAGTFKFNWFSIDNCAEAPEQAARVMTAAPMPHKTITLPVTKAYPNPFTAQLTVDLGASFNMATLVDMHGRVVARWNIPPTAIRTGRALGHLAAGVYLLQLEAEGRKEVIRVVKVAE